MSARKFLKKFYFESSSGSSGQPASAEEDSNFVGETED